MVHRMPGIAVQALDDRAAPPVELARPSSPRRPGGRPSASTAAHWAIGGGIRRALALEVAHRPDDLAGARGVADAPARHRVGLRAGVDDERPRLHLGPEGRDRRHAALVGERLVALVRHDPEAALDGEGRHRLQVGPPVDGAGRVVGLLRISARVRGVTAARSAATSSWKPRASSVGTTTGRASNRRTCSV